MRIHWLKISLLFVLFFVILCSVQLSAQQPMLNASKTNLKPAERFNLELILENSGADKLEEPSVSPFRILSGPASSYSMQWINGQRSSKRSWSYVLEAPKLPGVYTIPAFSVKDGKTKLQSNTIKITVSASSVSESSDINDGNDIFLHLKASKTKAYTGEAIVIEAVLLTNKDIANLEMLHYPVFPDCHSEEMRSPTDPLQEVFIKGRRFIQKTIHRVTIFPQRAGTINISPMGLVAYLQGDWDTQDPFSFFRQRFEPLEISSNALDITVSDVPVPLPVNFTGAVGSFSFQFDFPSNSFRTGEAFTVDIIAQGSGDLKRIQLPRQFSSNQIDIFDVRLDTAFYQERSGLLIANYRARYTLMAKDSGHLVLEMPVSWFDTEKQGFQKFLLSKEIFLEAGNVDTQERDSLNSVSENGSIPTVISKSKMTPRWILPLTISVAALTLAGMLFLFWKKRNTPNAAKTLITPNVPAKTALSIAKATSIEALALAIKQDLFYRLGTMTQKQPAMLNRGDFISASDSNVLDSFVASQWLELIEICDSILYSPVPTVFDFNELKKRYETAVLLVS
jgi:hypothetical protein